MPHAKFSEIYRLAATLLSPDHGDFNDTQDGNYTYSCPAISRAAQILEGGDYDPQHPARKFYPLSDVPYFCAFDEFPFPSDQQSARFLWLNMLAEIAESEEN